MSEISAGDSESVKVIDGLSVRSSLFSVECFQSNDRIGHRVYSGSDLLLTSVEDDSLSEWPASSPLQQIVSEPIGADKKPVLLGVGMAGKSHWSATIEADSFTEAMAFDMACRVAALPIFLGSTYRVEDAWQIEMTDTTQVAFRHTRSGAVACLDGIGRVVIKVDGRQIAIASEIDAELHARGKTYRWRYAIKSPS